jgi:flavin reductase (DIM6/NTAB) family NADH-FMN oxidoreductase RutF
MPAHRPIGRKENMPSSPASSVDIRTAFRAAMRRYAATVTIVTASDGSRRHGMTATAVTSLSLDPPSLVVCVNRKTALHDVLLSARRFCVNVLSREQADLSVAFGGAAPAEERFALGAWTQTADGLSVLSGAQAHVFCRKAALIPFGTHSIVVGEVEDIGMREAVEPLLYQDATYCVSVPAQQAAA